MDYSIPRLVTAGKTGTSSDQLSAQFVGFVPGMVTAVSMYQSDDAGNSVPLDDVGGLGQSHGGDWPVDVWIDYMKPATANLPGDDFPWKVESNRKVHNNAPTPAPSATTEAPQSAAEPTETPTPTETPSAEPTENSQNGGNGSNNGNNGNGNGGNGSNNGNGNGGNGSNNGNGGNNNGGNNNGNNNGGRRN